MLINKAGVKITHLRAMHGSLKIKSKRRFIFEKPKLKDNDPRLLTLNDRIMKIRHALGKF